MAYYLGAALFGLGGYVLGQMKEESGKKKFHCKEDGDSDLRRCIVKLYKRELDTLPDEVRVENFASADQSKHWVFVFKFDDMVLTYEGVPNEDNVLCPHWFEGLPPDLNADWEIENLKTIKTSRTKINEAAKENRFNGFFYNVVFLNCQHWAKETAKLLGIEVTTPTYCEANPAYALGAKVVGGMLPFRSSKSIPTLQQPRRNFHQ